MLPELATRVKWWANWDGLCRLFSHLLAAAFPIFIAERALPIPCARARTAPRPFCSAVLRSGARRRKRCTSAFRPRIEQALESLAGRIECARKPFDRSQIERRIGRLLGRNSRAASHFRVALRDDATKRACVKQHYSKSAGWEKVARASEGCYLLQLAQHTADRFDVDLNQDSTARVARFPPVSVLDR